jgi:aspartate racemase
LMIGRSPIPWLHIARVVADEAARRGFGRIGVLGTKYLMEGPVYRGVLCEKGMEMQVPGVARARGDKPDHLQGASGP